MSQVKSQAFFVSFESEENESKSQSVSESFENNYKDDISRQVRQIAIS